ncbi:MAG: hypothetical protein IKP86_03570 [Anaerolineaceae bacterium]|nr:hypothetical protein [Anaerolineaceae bacterium]
MKYIRPAGFFILFLLCGMALRWLLIDDTASFTRLMMHEFYRQDNIDILFAGSSHCYVSLDPQITDEIFSADTFNAGSALQAQDASFALIREAVEHYHVRHVFMEMYYLMMNNDEYRDRGQMTGTYIISDYMRPSLNKLHFLLNASSPKYYVNSFIPARRNWEGLLDPAGIMDLAKRKMTPEYRNFTPFDGYQSKGFVSYDETITTGWLLDNAGFDRIHPETASSDWLKTLREIIAYCEEKGVRLTLFSAPMTLFQTTAVGNYDDYISLLNSLTEGTEARYVDFNLCREEYFPGTTDLFADAGHMNKNGAALFSSVFARYFTGQITDEELFYGSMAEKISAHGPEILGLSFLDSGDGMRKLKIVSTMPEGTRYDVEFTPSGGSPRMLLSRSDDIYFEVPQEEHGTLVISGGGITLEMWE